MRRGGGGRPARLDHRDARADGAGRAAAEFEDVGAGTAAALGLGPGMERGIEYRVDLSGLSNAAAGLLSQDTAYTVKCDASR